MLCGVYCSLFVLNCLSLVVCNVLFAVFVLRVDCCLLWFGCCGLIVVVWLLCVVSCFPRVA